MRTCALALLALLVTLPVQAQPAADAPWTIDDVLTQRTLTDVDVGPDGTRVLWVKETPDPEADQTQSDLYLTYRNDPHGGDSTATIRLTRTSSSSTSKRAKRRRFSTSSTSTPPASSGHRTATASTPPTPTPPIPSTRAPGSPSSITTI